MAKENIFFDLDGTIINSMEGILNSLNYVISAYNLKELNEETLKTFIGPPLHDSFEKHFNVDFKTADSYVEKYREYYSVKGVFEFSLYEGIENMVKNLSKEYNLYITTSKPTDFAKLILEKANILKFFKEVSGGEKDKPDHSKAQVINYVMDKYKLKPETCLLIGDTKFDGEGAKISEIDFYGVSFGFGTINELKGYNPVEIFEKASDITKYFMEK